MSGERMAKRIPLLALYRHVSVAQTESTALLWPMAVWQCISGQVPSAGEMVVSTPAAGFITPLRRQKTHYMADYEEREQVMYILVIHNLKQNRWAESQV